MSSLKQQLDNVVSLQQDNNARQVFKLKAILGALEVGDLEQAKSLVNDLLEDIKGN